MIQLLIAYVSPMMSSFLRLSTSLVILVLLLMLLSPSIIVGLSFLGHYYASSFSSSEHPPLHTLETLPISIQDTSTPSSSLYSLIPKVYKVHQQPSSADINISPAPSLAPPVSPLAMIQLMSCGVIPLESIVLPSFIVVLLLLSCLSCFPLPLPQFILIKSPSRFVKLLLWQSGNGSYLKSLLSYSTLVLWIWFPYHVASFPTGLVDLQDQGILMGILSAIKPVFLSRFTKEHGIDYENFAHVAKITSDRICIAQVVACGQQLY